MRLTLPTHSSCTGCQVCIDSCLFNALVPGENTEGFIVPHFIEAACRHCHKCETNCPVLAKVEALPKDTFTAYPVAAWSLDKEIRLRSASGGAFAELAKAFVDAGGYVAGAVMGDGHLVRHVVTNSVGDLPRLQGSKYLQSHASGIYAQVKALLADSTSVLFSGTPCQVAGLRNFLKTAENIDKLLAVEIICHGVPSCKILEKFLETEKDITEIVSFRDKRNGWKNSFGLVVKKQNTETHIPYDKNYFTKIFLADNALRRSCYSCLFAGNDSQADLSLADFWRLKRWPEEHGAGVSAVIVRSVVGNRFLIACNRLHKETVSWGEVADGNPRLCSGKHLWLMRWHPLRLFLSRNLESMTPERFLRLYSGVAKLSPVTFGVKLLNRIWSPLLRLHRQVLLKKFLAHHGGNGGGRR